MAGLPRERTLELEVEHGTRDFVRSLEALGVAGPFRRLSPWEVEDSRGRHLLHAGGYGALPFGEAPPVLTEFAARYLREAAQTAFPQQSLSDLRAALARNLVALLAGEAPGHAHDRVVFANSGAEAIETALKMVRAYRPGAPDLVTFSGGYHGKTLGALSVTPNESYQAPFRPLLRRVHVVPYGDADALEATLLALGPDRVGGIVLEPVQGEAGVRTPPEGFLAHVDRVRRTFGVPVIADEVQSGLGRSGWWFASVAGGLDPDVITLAKPLSGGLVPIGATIARPAIAQALVPGIHGRRHSSTFAGGGLATAVALKSLELLVDGDAAARARRLGAYGHKRLEALAADHPRLVADVRSAGMLFAIELRPPIAPRFAPRLAPAASLAVSGLALRALHLAGVHACFSASANAVVRLTPALDMPEDLFEEMWDRVDRMTRRHPRPWSLIARTPPHRLARLASIFSAADVEV